MSQRNFSISLTAKTNKNTHACGKDFKGKFLHLILYFVSLIEEERDDLRFEQHTAAAADVQITHYLLEGKKNEKTKKFFFLPSR